MGQLPKTGKVGHSPAVDAGVNCSLASPTHSSCTADPLQIRKQRGFKMAFLNICSLPKHIDELRILMNNSPLDVIALNETRLDHLISSGEVGLSGYELVRLDRNRNGRRGNLCA